MLLFNDKLCQSPYDQLFMCMNLWMDYCATIVMKMDTYMFTEFHKNEMSNQSNIACSTTMQVYVY